MASKPKSVNVDLNSVFEGAASQFRGLNPNEPGQWPILPKAMTFFPEARNSRMALANSSRVGWPAPSNFSRSMTRTGILLSFAA